MNYISLDGKKKGGIDFLSSKAIRHLFWPRPIYNLQLAL
jgi:hypothetical protein